MLATLPLLTRTWEKRSTSCTTVTIVAYQRETAKSGEGLIHPTCLAGVLRKVCNTNQKMWYLSLIFIVYTKNIVHKYHTYHTCIYIYIHTYIWSRSKPKTCKQGKRSLPIIFRPLSCSMFATYSFKKTLNDIRVLHKRP